MDVPGMIRLQTVDSTNRYAERLLNTARVEEGTVISSLEQTNGEGQGSNTWESEPGRNALFSIILYPGFLPAENLFMMNKMIAAGAAACLDSLLPEAMISIKWPNDIYAGSKKLGGILIRNNLIGNHIESCIAGIGINVNQERFSPALPNPVSMTQLTGRSFDVFEFTEHMADKIMGHYDALKNGKTEELNRLYHHYLFGLNEWRKYLVEKMVITGRLTGVDDSGLFVLETENGQRMSFLHGDIEFILY
jgi:BirA family transcriptional regulator, biotin operon repressor / biotin---[acetyl-CoA-carboxylase] ligase